MSTSDPSRAGASARAEVLDTGDLAGDRAIGSVSCDWLIVGGGIHGVHVAVRLLRDAGVAPDRLCIVDPGERLLERWWDRVEVTGMTYMRSTSVHHLGAHAMDLRRFARARMQRATGLWARPYDRPAVELFRAHSEFVVERHGLAALHRRDAVRSCALTRRGARVELASGGRLDARRVVLAVGSCEQLARPSWAPEGHARIQHVFRRGFDGLPRAEGERVAIIGGGVTAAQVALRLQRDGHRVELISRHEIREHDFDTDPGWLGPKNMTAFERTRDPGLRRALVDAARHDGSIPPDVARVLRAKVRRDVIGSHRTEVARLDQRAGRPRLRLRDGGSMEVDRILLATGFASRRPGGAMVDDLVRTAALPCAPCGSPIVDADLRWAPGLHVTGRLAELELGPVARSIAGAQRAADRIVASAVSTAVSGARVEAAAPPR